MKKDSKREIRDYDRYDCDQSEYYGLLLINKQLCVDVKRMEKKLYHFDKKIIKRMKELKSTTYFRPSKHQRKEYMINIFRDQINSLKNDWRNEIRPAMKNIKTPKEVEDETRTGYFMQTGIMSHEENQMNAWYASLNRQSQYNYIMKTIIAQFIHQFMSVIESTTIKVLSLKGYKNERFSRNEFDSFIQGFQSKNYGNPENIIKLENLENYRLYDRMYKVWHFLKHNSMDLFNKVSRDYPEIIYDNSEYSNGQLAMGILKIDINYVNSLFNDSINFFEELCEKIFDENIYDANWNYDMFFIREVEDEIESITNPLGLPPGI